MALLKINLLFALLLCVMSAANGQVTTAAFDVEEVVCIDEPLVIKNTSEGAVSYEWNFCAIDLKKPVVETIDLPGVLDEPVYMDYVQVNSNYYAFIINYKNGNLVRLKFGDNLLNNPEVENLGNFGDIIPGESGAGGLQIVEDDGLWYVIIVAGYPPGGSNPRIIRIALGNSIENDSPVATDWGNLGNMYDPKDLVILKEGDNWYGFTVNSESNSVTRFDFGPGFEDPPRGTNLGNLGGLNFPTGLFALRDGDVTHMYITNGGEDTRITGYYKIVRLDFTSLQDESPPASDVGNVGNLQQHPRDIHILTVCDKIYGLVLNDHPSYNSFLHLEFLGSYTNHPNGSINGTNQLFNFPFSFTKFTYVNGQIIGFVVNKAGNSISRVIYRDCNNSSVQISNQKEPPPVTYNSPGIYTIKLTINKGLSSESSYCRQIVTENCKEVFATSDTTICANTSVRLQAAEGDAYTWTPALYLDNPNARSPLSTPEETTKYYVDVKMRDGTTISDTITVTVVAAPDVKVPPDTTVCKGEEVPLPVSGGTTYTWTPAAGLDDPSSARPVATAESDAQYQVRVGNNTACFTEHTVRIFVRQTPVFKASANTSICKDEEVQLLASGGDTYSWTPADIISDASAASTAARPTSNTVFRVHISEDVCFKDTIIELPVTVYSDPSKAFNLPNAFTPDGDGKNDCFGIRHWGNMQLDQFVIFNRWGQPVFRSNTTADCWDGRLKGVLQPSGTYTYIIHANTACGIITRKGMLTLIR